MSVSVRTDKSLLGRWWWSLDRYAFAGLVTLALLGILLVTAASPSVAERIGLPAQSRAVGAAVGANPVGYLIPCHRVLKSTGQISGYRWGVARKRAMLAHEAARRES